MFKIPLKLCGIPGKLLLKFNNDVTLLQKLTEILASVVFKSPESHIKPLQNGYLLCQGTTIFEHLLEANYSFMTGN